MKRLLTATAILGLVALMLPATAGIVLGQGDGSITFVKVISGDDKGPADLATFGLNYSDGVTTTTVVNNQVVTLPFGTYTAGENSLISEPGYSFVSAVCEPSVGTNDGDANVATVTEGQPNWTCTITNTYTPTGTLTFVKYINGLNTAEQGPAHPDQFSFTYEGTNGEGEGVVTLPKGNYGDADSSAPVTLPFGTYSVGEVVGYYLEHGYSLLADVCGPLGGTASFTDSQVTLSADHPNMECIFTNQYTPPVVHWFKIVQGGTAQPSDFTLTLTPNAEFNVNTAAQTVSGADGASTTVGWGSYDLTETGPANYIASLGGCSMNPTSDGHWGDSHQEATNITLRYGVWYCGFINTYVPPTVPSLQVATSCVGTATISGGTSGDVLWIDGVRVGTFPGTGVLGPLSEGVGSHSYTMLNEAGAVVAAGSFSISACYVPPPVVTPSPSPSPSVSPSPSPSPSLSPVLTPRPTPTRTPNGGGVGGAGTTLPPTSAVRTPSTGSDSPLLPLSMVLLCVAMTGLLFVRRPKSR